MRPDNDNTRYHPDPMAERWAQGFVWAIRIAYWTTIAGIVLIPIKIALVVYVVYKLAKFIIAI